MRVLLTGINYAPEESGNAPYTTGLAEYLVEQDHEVHVLTGQPHYPSWRKATSAPPETDGNLNGVFAHRRRHYVPETQSSLKRAFYEASFLGSGALLGGLPKPDVIVGIIPSLSGGFISRLAFRRFGVPYGLLFQDLMGRAAGQSGVAGGKSVEGVVKRGEGWLARGAQSVAVVAEGFRPYLESLGVAPDAIRRVRNWTHLPEPNAERDATRRSLGWAKDAFICLHARNMGHKQGLENVIEAARMVQTSVPELRFVLMGDGNQRAELEARAASYGLENLEFLPSQPDSSYVNTLAAADTLILSLHDQVKDMAFPSKVGSYVAAELPIIASVSGDSEIGKELRSFGAALMVEPGNADNLVEGLIRLASEEFLCRRLVKAAQEYGRQAFSRGVALPELEDFIYCVAGTDDRQDRDRSIAEVA